MDKQVNAIAIAIAVRQILLWEYHESWEWEDSQRAKLIYRDIVSHPVNVSPATAEACTIYAELQGRVLEKHLFKRLSPMRGGDLTEFAEQRKLQAELCN